MLFCIGITSGVQCNIGLWSLGGAAIYFILTAVFEYLKTANLKFPQTFIDQPPIGGWSTNMVSILQSRWR